MSKLRGGCFSWCSSDFNCCFWCFSCWSLSLVRHEMEITRETLISPLQSYPWDFFSTLNPSGKTKNKKHELKFKYRIRTWRSTERDETGNDYIFLRSRFKFLTSLTLSFSLSLVLLNQRINCTCNHRKISSLVSHPFMFLSLLLFSSLGKRSTKMKWKPMEKRDEEPRDCHSLSVTGNRATDRHEALTVLF